MSRLSTRSHSGARLRWVPLVVVAAVLVAGRAHAGWDEGPGPLPWRVGGTVGFTVDAAAFPDSAGTTLDVYVRIPPTTLESLVREGPTAARLRLTAVLKNRFGAGRHEATQEFEIAAKDTAKGYGRVVLLRFPAQPGPQRLNVKLEDLKSKRRGIAYLGRKVAKSGVVEGDLEVPSAVGGRELSNIEFAWSERDSVPSGVFARAGRRVLPNPERLYGLFAHDLRGFFTARSSAAAPWHWSAVATDVSGAVIGERTGEGPASPTLEQGFTIDVTGVRAGGYDLTLKAWQDGDAQPVQRKSHFSIAWQPDAWLRNPRDIEDNVHFLLSPDDEDNFALMYPGEQEAFMDAFWSVRDPSPGSPNNEARDTFLRRVQIANETYSRGTDRGMFSDMGRVFIRYGEPSDVSRQVIPAGDNTLQQAIRQIQQEDENAMGQVRQKGLGGDMRPFEVWTYEGDIPLPPDADPRVERNTRRKRLVFLFVDDLGLGEYRMRYSNE